MKRDLLAAIKERVLVCDGAMGTRLQALTGRVDSCIDRLNIDPDFQETVRSVHRSYVAAGAQVVLTNTYGANALKLVRYGLEKQAEEINLVGARLAREAVGEEIFVGGSVGPLEVSHAGEEISEDEARTLYREQMQALIEGGVDFLALETFQDLFEASCALKEAVTFGVPVLFEVGGVQNGRTGTGADAREFALLAERLGAHLMGANCRGPYDVLQTIRLLAGVTSLPLSAMPNAGSPEIDRGRVVYNVEPHEFRDYARRLVAEGAVLIGGCCGTNPRHIAQMAEAVRGLAPPPRRPLTPVHVVTREETTAGALPPERNAVAEVFASVPFIISVEMRPDRQTPLQTFLEAGQRLARQGVHLFDVPDNAGAKVAVDPMVAASRLQQATCIPSLIHLGTSHRNLVATQSYLLGAWYLGIQGILAVTGDHPNVGDHDKYATRVNDIKSSVNLMRLIRSLNEGQLFNRAACARCQFVVGGGFNPGRGLTAQVKWLERKIEAGCSFVYTQPVFRRQEIDQMQEAVAHLNIPILVGILPLTSRRNAEFFAAGKIPGIIVPPEILARFEHVESPQDGRRLGLDMAIELIQQLRPQIRGIYIIPPFGPDRYGMVAEILEAIRSPEGVAAGPAA